MASYTAPRRRSGRRWLRGLIVVTLVAGAAIAALAVRDKATQHSPAAAPAPAAFELAPEEVTRLAPRTLTATVRVTGSVRPLDQSQVKAEVAAKLAEVLVREGETVTRGQVLARFAVDDISARLEERQAMLAQAKATLTWSERARNNARELRQSGYGAQATLDQAEAKFRADQAVVVAQQAQLDMARKALADATVKAPIDGIVSERVANPGETFPLDAKLFTIVDPKRMEVEAVVPAREAAQLRVGLAVDLRVDGFEDRAFRGTIARISPTTQAGSRAVPVFVAIENEDGALKGGMFAVGSVTVAERADALALPPTAIRKDEAGDHVLVLESGQLVRRPVQPAESWAAGELVRVEGLAPGTLVVTAPLTGLKAGQPARVAGS